MEIVLSIIGALAAFGLIAWVGRDAWTFLQCLSILMTDALRAIGTGMVSLNTPRNWHKPDPIADHAGHELTDCRSDAMAPNELVATLCITCDEQLGPEVWSAKVDADLAALEAPPVEIKTESFVQGTEKAIQILHHEIDELRKSKEQLELELRSRPPLSRVFE